jgi:opacity protein-like surface antigen
MRRLFSIVAVLTAACISVGFSAQTASAFRGENDVRIERDYRGERDYRSPREYQGEREYQQPGIESLLYYSLSAGSWIPTHITYVDPQLTSTELSYDSGVAFSGAVGIDLGNFLRLENELSYKYASGRNNGNIDAFAWMVNAWIEPRNYGTITPYFGGGVGLGRGNISNAGLSDGNITGVAYQVGGGLDIRLDRRLSLDIGYRYFGISDSSNSTAANTNDLAGSTIMGGLRVRFR